MTSQNFFEVFSPTRILECLFQLFSLPHSSSYFLFLVWTFLFIIKFITFTRLYTNKPSLQLYVHFMLAGYIFKLEKNFCVNAMIPNSRSWWCRMTVQFFCLFATFFPTECNESHRPSLFFSFYPFLTLISAFL